MTTWTVEVKYLSINSIHYFRTEEEADSFISIETASLRAWGIDDFEFIKDSHTAE